MMIISGAPLWHPLPPGDYAGPIPTLRHVSVPTPQPLSRPPSADQFGSLKLEVYRLDAEAYAEITGAKGSGEGSVKSQYLLLELACWQSEGVVVIDRNDKNMFLEVRGAGLSIGFEAINVDIEANVDVGALAAATTLGMGRVDYRAELFGIDIASLPKGSVGRLGVADYGKLISNVEMVVNYLSDSKNWDKVEPVKRKVAYLGRLGTTPVHEAWSAHAALERIWSGQAWHDADASIRRERAATDNYIPLVARLIYSALNVSNAPDGKAKSLAGDLLWQGR